MTAGTQETARGGGRGGRRRRGVGRAGVAMAVAVGGLAAPTGASAATSFLYTIVSASGTVTMEYDAAGEGSFGSVGASPNTFTGSLKGSYRVNWHSLRRGIPGVAPASRTILFSTASIFPFRASARPPFGFTRASFGPIAATSSMSISGVGGDGVTRSCNGQDGIRSGQSGAPGTIGLMLAKQGGVLRTSVYHHDTNEGNLFGPLLRPECTEAFKSVATTAGQEVFGKLPITAIRRTKRGSRVTFTVRTTTPLTARTATGADVAAGTITQRSTFVLKLDRAT